MADTLRKGDLRKKLRPLLETRWERDFEIESKLRMDGDAVLPALRALEEAGGTKNFVALCEECGALPEAIWGKAIDTFDWLLDLGVSTSAEAKNGHGTDLLVVLAESRALDDDVLARLMKRVIDAGHDVDAAPVRGRSALGVLAAAGRWALAEPLMAVASEATKTSALIACLDAAENVPEDHAAFERIDEALERLDANGADAAGQTPLHVAAATGRLAIWDRVAPRVKAHDPALTGVVVRNGRGYPSAPGGGAVPSARFTVGSTPLDVVEAVRLIFARGRSVYEAAGALQSFHQKQLETILSRLEELEALAARLKKEGATSGAEKPVLEGAHGEVQKQLLRLAEVAGSVETVERAIMSAHAPGYGPLNFLLRVVAQCHDELSPAVRSDAHPLASLIRGTHQAKKVVYKARAKKDANTFHAKPADYPKEAKRAFKTLVIGLHGETVIAATVDKGAAVVWAITPDAMRSLGSVTEFLKSGVDVVLGEVEPEAVARPEPAPTTWVSGVPVCITGKMKRKRAEAERELAALGAVITKSVTKKTEVLFAGSAAGSKVYQAQQKGVLILDEAAMEMTLRGEDPRASAGEPELDVRAPAAPKEKRPLTPFPHVDPSPPADGEFETHHPSGAVRSRGRYEGGERVGTWISYFEGGEVSSEEHYVDGLLHGDNVYFHEASGKVLAQGRSEAGKSEGTWSYFHVGGELSHTREYTAGERQGPFEFREADGRVKATGTYEDDRLVGEWVWLRQAQHEKVARAFDERGSKHGVEAGWWPGGALAFHREWRHGQRVGRHEERAEDGTLIKLEQYDPRGRLISRTTSEGGEEKVEAFVDGVPKKLADDTKRLQKLANKLDDVSDLYKAKSALERVVDDGQVNATVQLLWARGLFALPSFPEFHELLTDDHAVSSETVMTFLAAAKEPKSNLLFEGWSRSFDEMVARVYARDPGPIDAGWRDLPERYRRGVAFVLARFGVDVGDALRDMGPRIAEAIVGGDMFQSIHWPAREGSEWRVERRALFERNEPQPLFETLLELVMDPADWPEVLLAAALEVGTSSQYGVRLDRFEPGFRIATLEQLEALLGNAQLRGRTAKAALLDWRSDSSGELERLALAIGKDDVASWVACAAVIRADEEGRAPSEEVVARIEADVGYPDNWLYFALEASPAAKRGEPAAFDEAVNFAARPGVGGEVDYPDGTLVFAALRALPEADVRARIQARLDRKWEATKAGPLLHLVDDPGFWRASLGTIVKASDANSQVVWGLGYLPPSALPMLVELEAAAPKKKRWVLTTAIAGVFARAASRGETWDAALDAALGTLFGEKRVPFEMLGKILYRLPEDRREAVMLAALDSGEAARFARATRMLAFCPTAPVLQRVFSALAQMKKVLPECTDDIAMGLAGFADRGPWIEWCMRNGAPAAVHPLFERADHRAFQALVAELAKEGNAPEAAPAKRAPDKIDEVVKLAKRANRNAAVTVPIFLFRETEELPTTLNRIGGLPPGTPADAWPTQDDDGMVHLFTLDLATTPELQAQLGGKRTVSLFVGSPDANEAFEPHTDEVAVVFRDEAETEAVSAAPEDTPVRAPRGFEVVRVDVPEAVFESDSELRGALYQTGARAGGEPLWLQGDEHQGGFIMQFDESFVDINLGDSGLMYVFEGTAFWQCH